MILLIGLTKVVFIATVANATIMSFIKFLDVIGILPRAKGFWNFVEH